MPIICEGKKIPSFNAEATSGKEIEFKNLLGRPIVLYFYPKDSTPGCTLEGEDFRDNYQRFRQQQATIFGISRDNLNSHEKFKSKYKEYTKKYPITKCLDCRHNLTKWLYKIHCQLKSDIQVKDYPKYCRKFNSHRAKTQCKKRGRSSKSSSTKKTRKKKK